MKTRRLVDLYVRGVAVTIDDGLGDPVTVWLQKLNPVEHEQAIRLASAHRAAYMAYRNQPESDEYKAVADQINQMEHDQLVQFVINDDLVKQLLSAEAKISAAEEWDKEGYLQGLKDIWPKMQTVLETNPDDEKARRVRDELQRFNEQVDRELDGPRADLEESYADRPDTELLELGTARMIALNADFEWTREFRKAQIWLATRNSEDHGVRYFESREEVDALQLSVLKRLQDEYGSVTVEPMEGKDLQETPTSLPSVEQPETEATGVSSGPLVAVQ